MLSNPRQTAFKVARWIRQYRAGLTISATVCFLGLGFYVSVYLFSHPNPWLHFLADIELRTLDMRFRLRGPRQPGRSVVIVAIDQKSQEVLGRWPFPRSYLAEAVDFLRDARARVVTFDIDFPQPDENSALQVLRQVRREYGEAGRGMATNARFEAQLKRLEAEADNDQRFAESLSRFDNAILGYFFLPKEETRAQNQERVKEFLNYLSFQAYPQIVHPEYGKLFEGLKEEGVSPNLPKLAQYAKNFGYVNVVADPDGTVRREPIVARFENGYYPSLDVVSVLAYTDHPLDQVALIFSQTGVVGVDIGRLTIPTDPGGYVQIDFYGPVKTFPTFSLADVVQRKLPKEVFRDRLVLIGATATGIGDMAVTPFQRMAFPGVEVHANFIDNILEGHFIRRGLHENLIDIAFILLFSLAAGVLLSMASAARGTAILLVSLAVYLWFTHYLFAFHRIWIAAFLPTATLAVNYAGIISYRFFFEEREKKKVRGAFQQYVAPGIINQLLARPGQLRLGGEEKELTLMFSDIRGFTTLSEGLAPSALVDLLNEYLSAMTDVIFRHWGTLDKYIGDAIMAFWGAPYPQPDHAERACRASVEMLEVLHQLQSRWAAASRPRIDIGVGINTGPMLVGNMGSTRRFNFTVMGDNVNLASRLEGLNKEFGTRVIVSEFTYQAVREKMIARELDLIRVKGKKKPVRIYELLGPVEAADRFHDLRERFHQGIEAYRNARWEAAVELFEDLLRAFPDDGPGHVFLKRCRELLEQPPEGVWDGVFVMETK